MAKKLSPQDTAVMAAQWQPYRDQIAGYRYSLDENGRFTLDGQPTGIFLVRYDAGRRIKAMTDAGHVMWSGASAEHFIRAFWYAEKVAA